MAGSGSKESSNEEASILRYVLRSLKDGNFYIGFTTNLHERLTSHVHGNSPAISLRRPFVLMFCEYFLSKADATRREGYFKTTAGKKALRIMLKESLGLV
ncbi:MAG: GIY-YIG nuclease family protein [bacterium]|nr:GIY-YIG nuclease family protein [bacterium]